MLADHDKIGSASLLLHKDLPRRTSVADGGQHTVAARVEGVLQREHAVFRVATALRAVCLDGHLGHFCVAKLSFVGIAYGMEKFDPRVPVEREPEFDQAARRLREIDRHDEAAIGPAGRCADDENRTPARSENARDGLAHEERAEPSHRRHAPDDEVGASNFGKKVRGVEGDSTPRAHADVMALPELQGVMRESANRIGGRRFAGLREIGEIERCVVARAQVGCAGERVVAQGGEIGDGKQGMRSQGDVLSEWLAPRHTGALATAPHARCNGRWRDEGERTAGRPSYFW